MTQENKVIVRSLGFVSLIFVACSLLLLYELVPNKAAYLYFMLPMFVVHAALSIRYVILGDL